MTNSFDICFNALMDLEGVDSNHPADPGGVTKYGVTQAEWTRFVSVRPGLPTDVRGITRDHARDYYKSEWWEPLQCSRLPLSLAYELFEFAVNAGRPRAVKALQAAVNYLDMGAPLTEDGVYGRMTQSAVFVICQTRAGQNALVRAFNGEQYLHYKTICERRPSLQAFAKGWTRRLTPLETA